MKMRNLFILALVSSFTFVSCNEVTTTGSATGTSTDSGDGGSDSGDGGGGNSSGNGGDGTTDTGNSGTDKLPLRSFNILLAGRKTWKPWSNYDSINNLGKSTMPSIVDMKLLLQSDSKLDMRVQLKSQAYWSQLASGGSSDELCYGRKTTGAADSVPYKKISFRYALRDVTCSSGTNSNYCTLGTRYASGSVSPIEVGSYSPVIELGSKRNPNAQATVIEIYDVAADNTCYFDGTDSYCDDSDPYGLLRPQSCWEAVLEFSTDYTVSF